MASEVLLHRTDSGFRFGAAEVSALASNAPTGHAIVGVTTPRAKVQIIVTRTGHARIYLNGKEMHRGE